MVLASKNYYLLRIINYIILLALLIFLNKEGRVIFYQEFILVLLYIFNSQSRLLTLQWSSKKREIVFLSSVLVECIIIFFLFRYLGVYLSFLLYVVILDLILYLKKNGALILVGALGLLSILFELIYVNEKNLAGVLFNVSSFLIFTILGFYLKEEEVKKKRAQDLYDRLRVSEEKLAQANKELELYSNTVEEITLLRERTRVSKDLHDSIGHSLSTLCIQLKAVKTLINKDPEAAVKMLEANILYVGEALESVRRTVRELKPIEFEAYEGIFTIAEMVKNFSKLTGVKVKFILSKEKWKLTSEQSQHLYRIIQESLSNAVRHGQAQNICITIQFLPDKLYAQIKDDGKGCQTISPSFGLKGIDERIKKMKGFIEFYTGVGKGFEIAITLPKYAEMTKVDLV